MTKRIRLISPALAVILWLLLPSLGLAQSEMLSFPWGQFVASTVSFLVPVGIILVAIAALPPEQAPRAGLAALLAAALGALAYWAAGFALQFGGIGLIHDIPTLRDLSWEWSLLDVSWGPGWGMAGLRGFFLSYGASSPHGLALFLSHLPWVMTASALPGIVLSARKRTGAAFLFSIVLGGLLYPLFGNWVWGGGWLANLGQTRSLGHGFVDFGGSSAPFLLAGSIGLAALLLWRSKRARSAEPQMPAPHLPLVAMLGLFLTLAGASGWLLASPQAASAGDALPRAAVNAVLSCLGGGLVAGFYTWFVARKVDLFMTARGALAGLVASLGCAPFMPAWAGWAVGAVAGLLLPLVIYLVDHVLNLADDTAIVATFGVAGLIGTLAPGLLADGLYGAGWNGVGAERFLGVDGLGVTGLLAHVGTVAGWEGQMVAQLAGASVVLVWGFVLPWALGRLIQGVGSLLAKASAALTSSPRGSAGS